MEYSVLMSVYAKEKEEYLEAAIRSIFTQTVSTNDFVLVCDGPLTKRLDECICQMQQQYGEGRFHVIRLEENVGLGRALNIGLGYCKNDVVARMDSDDISRPERCEKQLRVFESNDDISIVSGTVEEFSESIDVIDACRIVPKNNEEIIRFAKRRNPFNHPCVMYRKQAVEAAGGYQDFYRLEDYYLWVRMLAGNNKGYNLQEPLLWMRAGTDMYKRRSGLKYIKAQIQLFSYMKKIGFISTKDYLVSIVERTISSALPNSVRKKLFRVFVRIKGEKHESGNKKD